MNTAAEYATEVLKNQPAVTNEHEECEICGDEGKVLTRHEELDDVMLEEVWLMDYCECRIGQRLEDQDIDFSDCEF